MTDRGARSVGLVLALGGLLVVVDTTVTVVAVPAIVADLDSTLPVVQWVTSGYLLGVVAVIPIAGWAANRFGARRVYLAALVIFTLFSALCALAWSAGSLIAFRVLQGLGGGLLNPVGQAIGLRAVPRSQRGRMMSLLGLPVLIGPPLGPPLSGWLVDVASWRWIFLVNVPVGVVAVVLCTLVIPRFDASASGGPVDRLGLALLSGGAVSLVLGCTVLGDAGEATASALAGLLAGAVLLAAFVRRALRIERPLIELRLLRHRPLGAGVAVLGCFGAAYFGAMSVLPIFVQAVRGDPAILAGLVGLP
ncbi:MAG TPA: DHA2 family efflux MFS transporter permease subunit, partial [Pseudonocardia sp.]